MNTVKAFLRRTFVPQKHPSEGKKTLLLAMVVYALLLIWVIVFKFSAISAININSSLPLGRRILNGLCFFDFFLSSNPWRLVRGLLIAMLNVLLFLPWGIYASFFYDQKRSVTFACMFALLVECIQLFARFGVFSFEDVALNTLGAFLGVLIFEKYICRLPERATLRANQWVVRVGIPFSAVAYFNVVVAMILYFS